MLDVTDRAAVIGRTGSGKTFLVRHLLADPQYERLIVADPKGRIDAGDWGLQPWDKDTQQALDDGAPVRALVRTPVTDDPAGAWEAVFKRVYHAENVTLYIDEGYGVLAEPGARPGMWLNAIFTRGREKDISAIVSIQRPAWVPLVMLTEADVYFIFRLNNAEDRKKVAGYTGPEVLQPPRDPYGFWVYSTAWDRPVYSRGLEEPAGKGVTL